MIHRAGIAVTAFDEKQLELARLAFRRYGRGRHAAGLNFGDCAVYGLARSTGEPLLYKGEDFSKTDVPSVIAG